MDVIYCIRFLFWDIDMYGYMYNVVYVSYFEVVLSYVLRVYGLDQGFVSGGSYVFLVCKIEVIYVVLCYYDDEIFVMMEVVCLG